MPTYIIFTVYFSLVCIVHDALHSYSHLVKNRVQSLRRSLPGLFKTWHVFETRLVFWAQLLFQIYGTKQVKSTTHALFAFRLLTRNTDSNLPSGSWGTASSVSFFPTHKPCVGNLLQSRFSGHWKPNLFIRSSHPRRAWMHSSRHGGIGFSSIVHTGAYIVHKKNLRYGLQFTCKIKIACDSVKWTDLYTTGKK